MKKFGRLRQAVLLQFVVLAHLLIFWSLGKPASRRTAAPEHIQWIEARPVMAPLRKPAVPAARAVVRQPSQPSHSVETPVVSTAISLGPATEPIAAPAPAPAPPLDLSPEKLGSLLDKARRGDLPRMPPSQSWRAAADEKSGPVRLSETVGASGSRVTRVEGPFGTYCIRSPQPGRPPPSGAGPESALPTNCP